MNSNTNAARIPTIFVSSTCYDLSQVRTDLKLFIDGQLGFESLLSETNSFPLAPGLNSVDNCLRIVRERADLFILIIGGRYGSIANNGKSITNLEYIQAKAKGIPIYTFIDKKILNILPVWKSNPSADFSSVADSTSLFEFVDMLRDKDNVWVHGFDNAQDIMDIIKKQIAYLFYDCLKLQHKYTTKSVSEKIASLDGEAFKLAIERPQLWEYRLFGEVLKSELKKSSSMKNDFIHGISFSDISHLSDPVDVCNRISEKVSEILKIINGLTVLMNEALPIAFGAPGESGDAEHIIYIAERMGVGYRNVLAWGSSFNSSIVPEDCRNLVKSCAKMAHTPINDIESYCIRYDDEMKNAQLLLDKELDEVVRIDLTLTLNSPDLSEFEREMSILEKKYR